jgi:magnesium-transporting ATPase (P-type)
MAKSSIVDTEKPHALTSEEALESLATPRQGLSLIEAAARLERFGPNALPRPQAPGIGEIFLRQFKNPLIYVLLLAAIISLLLQDWSDAGFIFAVLLINAGIGAYQEYSAQRAAQALQNLVTPHARVERDGEVYEIDAAELVPGDIVLLESGAKVPADARLLDAHNLSVDESLLTGESLAVIKDAQRPVDADSALGDRFNMVHAGTMVGSGRGRAVVVRTGLNTELGRIASSVLAGDITPPPLLVRMQRFTYRVAIAVGVAAVLMVAVALVRGTPLAEIFVLAVALAVSAIPEGLPVALTVALAVGMQRMAKRSVIVRKLVAVEALGSCTYIASDKTGTLTVNQLTVRRVQFPDQPPWEVTGEGLVPEGTFVLPQGASLLDHELPLQRLCRAVVLANEGVLARREEEWVGHGDAADLALLVLAHKAGFTPLEETLAPQLDGIPYEPERRFAASLNRIETETIATVKGAVETLLPMCGSMLTAAGPVALVREEILAQANALAAEGYRVLAVADGEMALQPGMAFSREHLTGLTFLGLVAMTDPLRPEVKGAVDAAQRSGIRVGMVTGDHPDTALAIARELEFAERPEQVVTGSQLNEAMESGQAAMDRLCRHARVFSRVEPQQKLEIVESLQRAGHFVAVTGDGVNDAPALRAAQVGVAMGRSGTDVARETSDIVITDDNFASIVAGIEEGRIAYGNIRKVIFLLISTGAAEIVLFALALISGAPLPLLAVQLLWLNLVTNGIQDVALAFEPAEGDELRRPPRLPKEAIFNRIMIERVLLSALVIGGLAYAAFEWLLLQGYSEAAARNGTLLLMVLFENVQAFNSRSETRSLFHHSPLRNRLLLFGVIVAQAVHIGAMYTPGLRDVLGIAPVAVGEWLLLLGLASVMLLAMEAYKWLRGRRLLAPAARA